MIKHVTQDQEGWTAITLDENFWMRNYPRINRWCIDNFGEENCEVSPSKQTRLQLIHAHSWQYKIKKQEDVTMFIMRWS